MTDWLEVTNRAESTLNGAIDDNDLALTVVSAALFPASFPFRLTIDDEIVEVTSGDGSPYVITRGAESTTPAAHLDGAIVRLKVTAGIIGQLQTAVGNIEGGSMLDDTAGGTNALVTKAPTSNVMYDHGVAATGVHGVGTLGFKINSKQITITRDLTAATGSVAYTGVGFTPTVLIVAGAIDGTNSGHWSQIDSGKTGQGETLDYTGFFTSYLPFFLRPASGAYQTAAVASYDADGFTLAWTKVGSPTGTGTFRVLCLK